MYGSIITWRIGETDRSGAGWDRFQADCLVFWAQVSRLPGYLSGHATRTAEDTMVSVSVYASQAEADSAIGVILPRVLAAMGDRVALVERSTGPVLDLRWSVT